MPIPCCSRMRSKSPYKPWRAFLVGESPTARLAMSLTRNSSGRAVRRCQAPKGHLGKNCGRSSLARRRCWYPCDSLPTQREHRSQLDRTTRYRLCCCQNDFLVAAAPVRCNDLRTRGSPQWEMERFRQCSDVTVLQNEAVALASSLDGDIHHHPGQVVGANHQVGEHCPEHG